MTLQDLLRSPDPANIKLAAIIATPEQFHEAVLGEMEWFEYSDTTHAVRYASTNEEELDLYASIRIDELFLVCRYRSQSIYGYIFDMKKTENYLKDLDGYLRRFTSTIQKRLCQISS